MAVFLAARAVIGAGSAMTLIQRARAQVTAISLAAAVVISSSLLALCVPPANPMVQMAHSALLGLGGLPIAFAGIFVVIGLAVVWARVWPRGASPIAYAGRLSLAIFVGHIVFASGSRIALEQIGVNDPSIQFVVGVTVGVLRSIVLFRASVKVNASWLFPARTAYLAAQVDVACPVTGDLTQAGRPKWTRIGSAWWRPIRVGHAQAPRVSGRECRRRFIPTSGR
jgi:hypothetical protein